MITEMQVLERLKTVIATDLIGLQESEEGISIEHFDDKNIEIDFPDVARSLFMPSGSRFS